MLPRRLRTAPLAAVLALAALTAAAPVASAAVPVPKSIRVKVTPGRDAKAPFVFRVTGQVIFRKPVPRGACAGVVSMALKANGLPVQLKAPKVNRKCRFATVFTVKRRAELKGARRVVIAGLWLRLGAPTSVIAPTRTVRVR